MNSFYHLTARALPGLRPLQNTAANADLWRRLRLRFPKVAACVLMPNHLHILVATRDPQTAQLNLSVELRAWTQQCRRGSNIWSPVPMPQSIPDLKHLKRQVRYVHLNPCRSYLVSDPLMWEWSTHRDVTGCTVSPWPDMEVLARTFGTSAPHLGEVLHRYVSADPTVAVQGTAPAIPPPSGALIIADLAQVHRAAAAARRESPHFTRGPLRNLTVQTAASLGMRPDPLCLKVTLRTWQRLARQSFEPSDMHAVLRVLADPRCMPRRDLGTTGCRENVDWR